MNLQTSPKSAIPDLERNQRDIRSRIFNHMLLTRGEKYRSFLRYLRFFKYAACAPDRGEFLESYYTLMRYLDDIVDGDAPVPEGFNNEMEYISAKINFTENPIDATDEVDYLFLYCQEVARRFGANFTGETRDILHSLKFDANRKGKWMIFPKSELQHHFFLLDIRGTIRATLKVFNDDPDKYKLLEPLGMACRHQYDIEDIDSDLSVGYVNIPAEDCNRFNIIIDKSRAGKSDGVREWLRFHAQDGMRLLEEHHQLLPQGNFSLLEKLVFRVVYENPARATFMKTLS